MTSTGSSGKLREYTAAKLRGRLAEKRISASEFARRVGWSQPYMARRYDGRVALDVDDLEVIAREMGISVSDLFKGSDEQTTAAKIRLAERTIPHEVDPRQPKGRPRRDRPAEPQPNGQPIPHPINPASRRPVRVPRVPVMASAV